MAQKPETVIQDCDSVQSGRTEAEINFTTPVYFLLWHAKMSAGEKGACSQVWFGMKLKSVQGFAVDALQNAPDLTNTEWIGTRAKRQCIPQDIFLPAVTHSPAWRPWHQPNKLERNVRRGKNKNLYEIQTCWHYKVWLKYLLWCRSNVRQSEVCLKVVFRGDRRYIEHHNSTTGQAYEVKHWGCD